MNERLDWFLYVERKADGRRAILAGPYTTAEEACSRKLAVIAEVENRVKDGCWLCFETWGHCSAPTGTLAAKLGRI